MLINPQVSKAEVQNLKSICPEQNERTSGRREAKISMSVKESFSHKSGERHDCLNIGKIKHMKAWTKKCYTHGILVIGNLEGTEFWT